MPKEEEYILLASGFWANWSEREQFKDLVCKTHVIEYSAYQQMRYMCICSCVLGIITGFIAIF